MKKGATDHGCDAWRYLLMAREPLSAVPMRDLLDRYDRYTYRQWLRVYMRSKRIVMISAQA